MRYSGATFSICMFRTLFHSVVLVVIIVGLVLIGEGVYDYFLYRNLDVTSRAVGETYVSFADNALQKLLASKAMTEPERIDANVILTQAHDLRAIASPKERVAAILRLQQAFMNFFAICQGSAVEKDPLYQDLVKNTDKNGSVAPVINAYDVAVAQWNRLWKQPLQKPLIAFFHLDQASLLHFNGTSEFVTTVGL